MDLKIDIISASYGKKKIIGDISVNIPSGSFTAVIGRNGSGKSTLLYAIDGIIPFEGSIMAGDADISSASASERARLVSIMLQQTKNPHITVEELVSFGRRPYRGFGEAMTKEDLDAVERAISDAELSEIRGCYLDEISGGELRRSYFGMILAQNTPIVLLDEATAFLDTDREMRFLDMMDAKRRADGKTVISVMHDLSAAMKYADNVMLIDGGRLIFFGSVEDILKTDLIERTFSVKRYTACTDCGERIFFSN